MSFPMTTTQVALALDISISKVRQLCNDGTLRHYKIPGSKHRRITPEAVREMLEREGWPECVKRKFAPVAATPVPPRR